MAFNPMEHFLSPVVSAEIAVTTEDIYARTTQKCVIRH